MILHAKFAVAGVAALLGVGAVCPLCDAGGPVADAQNLMAAQQASDTATVKLHISGMTCGSCPLTAQTALKKLPGVLSAVVTLDDSLGVVRYDPRKVTPEQIVAHLERVTDYRATVVADTTKAPRRSATTP